MMQTLKITEQQQYQDRQPLGYHGTVQIKALSVQEGNYSIRCAITSYLTSLYYKRIKAGWLGSKHWPFYLCVLPWKWLEADGCQNPYRYLPRVRRRLLSTWL